MLIDFHTHRPTLLPGLIELESMYFGQSKSQSAAFRSVGLHPWYLQGIDLKLASEWVLEQAAFPDVAAIGEAGLDKVCKTPWDVQYAAFQHCAKVAELVKKPLIIHCVRAYAEIIEAKKHWNPQQPWILHGFDKNLSTAESLLRSGFYLSFGYGLFRERGYAADALRETPEDRFFLETDDGDKSILEVYERAAGERGISAGVLERQMELNFERVFKGVGV